jgi:hypothetical protein
MKKILAFILLIVFVMPMSTFAARYPEVNDMSDADYRKAGYGSKDDDRYDRYSDRYEDDDRYTWNGSRWVDDYDYEDVEPAFIWNGSRWVDNPDYTGSSGRGEKWVVTDASTAIAGFTADSIVFVQPEETYFAKGKEISINRSQKYNTDYADAKVEKWTAYKVQTLIDKGWKDTRVMTLSSTTTELKSGAIIRVRSDGKAMVSASGTKKTTVSAQEKEDKEEEIFVDLRW